MPQPGRRRREKPQAKQEQTKQGQSGQKRPEQPQLEKRQLEKLQPGQKQPEQQSIFSHLTLPELEMARDKLRLALEDSSKKSQIKSADPNIIAPQKPRDNSRRTQSSTKLIRAQLGELEVALHQRQRTI